MTFLSYAQNMEDIRLWRALGGVSNGTYVDIGAQHPVDASISRGFYEKGWRGLHVEATPGYAELLRENRPDEPVLEVAIGTGVGTMTFFEFPGTGLSTGRQDIAAVHSANGFDVRKIEVPVLSLCSLFDELPSRDIHWMSIDVEGMEFDVLSSWGESSVRPWILVIESTFPTTQEQTHTEWEGLVKQKRYFEVHFDGLNRYFVHQDHKNLGEFFRSPPNLFDDACIYEGHYLAKCLRKKHKDEIDRLQAALNRPEIAGGPLV